MCVADRGELHRVAVMGQNATLLQEIPLFTSQEPVNNILLHQVEHLHSYSHILHRHAYSNLQCLHKCVSLCFQGQALVGSPLSLAQVQAEGCALYHSCEVCARARSLGCVWSDKACILTTAEWVRLEYHNEVEDFQKSKADCSTAGVENGSVTLCVNTEPFSLQHAQNMLRFQAF